MHVNLQNKTKEVKKLIGKLEKNSKYVPMNIFKSVYNINLNTVIGYHKNEEHHHFLDDYNKG